MDSGWGTEGGPYEPSGGRGFLATETSTESEGPRRLDNPSSQGDRWLKRRLGTRETGVRPGCGRGRAHLQEPLLRSPGPTWPLSEPQRPPQKRQAGQDAKPPRLHRWSPSDRWTHSVRRPRVPGLGHREALTSRRWASHRWAEAGAGLREAGQHWWFPIHPVTSTVSG